MKQSIFYQNPTLYQLMLLSVHGKHLKERYTKIADKLQNVNSVFEPLCGPAVLPKYISEGLKYSGFDINEVFVKYAQKKGYNIWQGDAHENASWRDVIAEGVVLIDALHHIQPYTEQQRVVERAAKAAKTKVLICDPFGDRYFAMIDKFPFLQKPIEWFFNWAETDGPNQSRYDTVISRETLEKRMDEGYGVLSGVRHDIQQAGPEDLIATYYL